MTRTQNDVIEAVAVHIASRRDAGPGIVSHQTLYRKAGTPLQSSEVDLGRATRSAEDNIRIAGISLIFFFGTDNQVVDPVPVNVPRRCRASPNELMPATFLDDKAVGA